MANGDCKYVRNGRRHDTRWEDFLKEDKSINLKGSEQLQLVSPTGGTRELAKLEQPKNHSATATS